MLIEISTLPTEIQQQISKVEQGEIVSFTKNGKVFANLIPIKQSAYDAIMASDFPPEVGDIDFDLPKRQMPSKDSLELFD